MNFAGTDWCAFDQHHVWHPYSVINSPLPVYPVVSASGVRLQLADGRELIDGMASWWCAIHGYNHPEMNQAIRQQVDELAHVMFGGLTHRPAVELATRLIELTPRGLETVFFADSGSVSVEVALKMAIQYWHARQQPEKQRFVTIRNGYHGDTFGAMSVCDPVNGMHKLFTDCLAQQYFADAPTSPFGSPCGYEEINSLRHILEEHGEHIAALILEPIVQGAGGMRFYSADYLREARQLCNEYKILLIADEIATGFGRTGKLFACEHAGITPDILCVGKALTAGYLSLAATLATRDIAETISRGEPGVFMHGPTFMANPLACTAGLTSLRLLLDSPWQERISTIERGLETGLAPCRSCAQVADVRVLGAIGVVELHEPVDMKTVQPRFVDAGVWVRPFGRLIYLMPPFIINENDLLTLTSAVNQIVREL
jgi:adenosylmethionine-8-amino-7-oxononanoate aminotransferase